LLVAKVLSLRKYYTKATQQAVVPCVHLCAKQLCSDTA
jgi:hypothetical protein